MSISPAGNHIAFIGVRDTVRHLYLRALDSPEAVPMAGTQGAYCTPTFSPDGQWLAFLDARTFELKKIPIQGGPAQILTKITGGLLGASWGGDDAIIYSDGIIHTGVKKVSAVGGTPISLTQVDANKGETEHRWPFFLPGGKAFLFAIERGNSWDDAQIVAQRLDTRERHLLVQGGTYPQYVSAGYLVFVRGGKLMAVPFDAARLQVRGRGYAVSELVHESNFGASQFALSTQGSLVYVPPSTFDSAQRRLLWVGRDGTEHMLPAPARNYRMVRLAPDERRAAVEFDNQIWLYDLSKDTLARFTFEGEANGRPVWSPDGKRIAFASYREGSENIFWQLADGSGQPERLISSKNAQIPLAWSPDGLLLVFVEFDANNYQALWILELKGLRAQPFVRMTFNAGAPTFSPDGRWLAYASDESGRPEIYVQPYPGPGGKRQISTDGGTEPAWRRNGISYFSGNKMMVVDVVTEPAFSAGKPQVLFEGQYTSLVWPNSASDYDSSADGQRFLMTKPSGGSSSVAQINVVLNWFEELKHAS